MNLIFYIKLTDINKTVMKEIESVIQSSIISITEIFEQKEKELGPGSFPEELFTNSPHHIHGSSSNLRVAAHDGHTGSKRAVDTENNKLSSPW